MISNPIVNLLNSPASLFAQQHQQMQNAAAIQRLLGHTFNGLMNNTATEKADEQPLDLRFKAKER
jgi:hypothetical protein